MKNKNKKILLCGLLVLGFVSAANAQVGNADSTFIGLSGPMVNPVLETWKPPADCQSQTVQWSGGGSTCSNVASGAVGSTQTVNDSAGNGSAIFYCNPQSSTLVYQNGSCFTPIASNDNGAGSPSGSNSSGTGASTGSGSGSGGSSSGGCTPGQTFTWGTNNACQGVTNCSQNNCTAGSTSTLNSTTGQGSTTILCNAGQNQALNVLGMGNWALTNGPTTCNGVSSSSPPATPSPTVCAKQTIQWGPKNIFNVPSCSATSPTGADGAATTVSSTYPSGSVPIHCGLGSVVTSGPNTGQRTYGWVVTTADGVCNGVRGK